MRGPGDVYGKRQSGYPDLKIATWQDTKLIILARESAEKILSKPEKYKGLLKTTNTLDTSPN